MSKAAHTAAMNHPINKPAAAPRAKRAKPKATVAPTTFSEDFDALLAKHGIEQPRREIVASVVGLITTGTVGYFGAYSAGILATAALIYTGSTFLSFMIMFLGVIAAFLAAMRAGNFMSDFIATGGAERCYQKCSNAFLDAKYWVTSKVSHA